MNVRTLMAARADLRNIARSYDEQPAGIGDQFRAALRSAIERVTSVSESCQLLDHALR